MLAAATGVRSRHSLTMSSPSETHAPPGGPPRRSKGVPISTALVAGVVALNAAASGSVLAINYVTAREATLALLRGQANLGLTLLEGRVESQLAPVREMALGVVRLLADPAATPDEAAIAAVLRATLTAVPQATGIVYVTADARVVQASRSGADLIEIAAAGEYVAGLGSMLEDADAMHEMMEGAEQMRAPAWLPPIWVHDLKQPVLALEAPARRADEFAGVLFVVVALGDVANFLADLKANGSADAFVLYGGDRVLAHPDLMGGMYDQAGQGEAPLPPAAMFRDPTLAMLASGDRATIDDRAAGGLEGFRGIAVDDEVVVVLRELTTYGTVPWQIALKLDRAQLNHPLDQLRTNAIIGGVILGIAVLIALLVGRSLARQIERLAASAARLTRLDAADAAHLPDSRFRELSVAAQAFNSMTAALRWFETYVPKSLVLRLMDQGGDDITVSHERVMTVMFTDIRGFSTLAEDMQAKEIADLLNRHFELLSSCIEAEGGTVDKFIGDSVMAFWGAPEQIPDHAERALRAARAIQRAVVADCRRRRESGEPVVAVRVGLHTGPVVVGNIGSSSRVNYTVVGDTVNAASRIESLSKEMSPGEAAADDDCTVFFSAATGASLSGLSKARSLGRHRLRGRAQEVEVYRLLLDET